MYANVLIKCLLGIYQFTLLSLLTTWLFTGNVGLQCTSQAAVTVKHSCRKTPGMVNFTTCINFCFCRWHSKKLVSQNLPVPCQQQLVPGLMLGVGSEDANRALFCPGKAAEEMRNPLGMRHLRQGCPAPSLQVLIPARLLLGRKRSSGCSEGETVFTKKRTEKWSKITGSQVFYYLLETSKIRFISSVAPLLNVGEMPAMTSPLGSTTHKAGITDSWTRLGLS